MKSLLASILAVPIGSALAALDAKALTDQYFGNDAPWYVDRIPLFESSDEDISKVYYYRWSIFRAHQRDLGAKGFISTEFLDDVGWQTNPWASLNDATGFHLNEGRWCRDRRFKEDYATHMYSSDSNTRQFSESMADSVWRGYLVDGDAASATSRLDAMQGVFEAWADSFDTSKGLYQVEPLRDATEYTISSIDATNGADGFTGGNSFRPSINSYQFANAKAIAALASLKGGQQRTVDKYNDIAQSIKDKVQGSLWNSTLEHFIDRYYVNNNFVRYWDPIRGRELVGYVPWAHDLPDDNSTYSNAWKHMLDPDQLAGPHGLRTVEPSYEYYMRQYRYEGTNRECQWNGPAWPYQMTQVLTGLANLLDHYPDSRSAVSVGDYVSLLRQYAKLHYNPSRGGVLNLEEDYDSADGAPIVGLKRSSHYFHSGYIDNVLSGLIGIRARADDVLEVNPLADSSVTYFRADKIPYHGHEIAVQWDATGSKYGTKGLVIEVDGAVVKQSDSLSRLEVPVERKAVQPIERRIAKSVQLQITSTWPRGSVSVANADAEQVHDAIDGRIWFYTETEVANGWDSPQGGEEVWYQVDFGADTVNSAAEIAFFANEQQGYDVPQEYRVQNNATGSWNDVRGAKYADPVANGVTTAEWDEATQGSVRLVFTPKEAKKVRLVEFKIY